MISNFILVPNRSNAVGKSAGDLSLCASLFPCRVGVDAFARGAVSVRSDEAAAAAALRRPTRGIFAQLFSPVQSRLDSIKLQPQDIPSYTSCKVSGSICPGIIIGML